MDWRPYAVFAIVGAAMVVAQDRYFRAMAERGDDLFSDAHVATTIRNDPKQLLTTAARVTSRRLKALMTRQSDRDLEHRRLVAGTFVVLTILAFVWVAGAGPS